MTHPAPPPPTRRRVRALTAALVALVLVLGACGGDDDDAVDESGTTAAPTDDGAEGAAEPLQVLVTNDDGFDADGIDVLVEALAARDDVELTVVAPSGGRSGGGGTYTDGAVETVEDETASGHPATAVVGWPADTVRVAIDQMGLEPHLVVSGINAGQNVGPYVDVSGTIGAARAAVVRGFPALAVSSGYDTVDFDAARPDYDAAVPLVMEWIDERLDDLLARTVTAEVANLNVPSCEVGEVRGLLEVPADLDGDVAAALGVQDCASTVEDPPDDVSAFTAGFATLSVVPDAPATPPVADTIPDE